jgi:dTDP-4-amino-4,6-dideoxy-D-glucose ammonia-lyase
LRLANREISLFDPYSKLTDLVSIEQYIAMQGQLIQGAEHDYWTSTILPMMQSGHLQAAAENRIVYPGKINLFIGLSCMFKCSFCGRNHNSYHKNNDLAFDVFKRLVDEDNGSDPTRFGISGGQEPLTNPRSNDIFKLLSDSGYRARIITNGFMLTPEYVGRNPYLLSLDNIRVSLYGVCDKSTSNVTKNGKAFARVKDNLTNLTSLADRPRIGLNFVLLPDNVDDLDSLLRYIDEIGGVDYISLREDFSFEQEVVERTKLPEKINAFKRGCFERGVGVDLGYALASIASGFSVPRLARASHQQISPYQSPQVKVAVLPNGNFYSHLEAAFIGRPCADRHILGNIASSSLMHELAKKKRVEPEEGDTRFMDAFNHVIELFQFKLREDMRLGIDIDRCWKHYTAIP